MSMRSKSGPGDLAHVAFDLGRRAVAGPPRVAAIAARAGVQGGDEHEVRRKGRAVQGPADRHRAVLQRLAEDFQRAAIEFRKLVEEQYAVMAHRDLPGVGVEPPPPAPRR